MGDFLSSLVSIFTGKRSDIPVDRKDFNRFSTDELERRLLEQPELRLDAESVYDDGKSEERLLSLCDFHSKRKKRDLGIYLVCDGMGFRLGTAEKYVKVYGVDSFAEIDVSKDLKQPFLMPIVTTHEISPWKNVDEEAVATFKVGDSALALRRFGLYIYYGGKKQIKWISDYAEWPMPFNTIAPYRPCLGYIKKYEEHFEEASNILHNAHPEIYLDNVRIWFRQHFIHELRNLDSLDIWQDISACKKVECEHLEDFKNVFMIISKSEKLYTAWKIGTFLKGNMSKQGYGPGQIILDLAMESADYNQVSDRYLDYIPKEAFRDQDEMLKAILHPVYSIYVKALTYDYILTRMKETVFRSPEVRFASDVYPFISSHSTARQMALINMVQIMSLYPERDQKLKSYMYDGPNMQMFNNFCVYAKLLNIEPNFEGLKCVGESYEKIGYTSDYFGNGQIDGKIKADLPWTIYTMQPE